MKKSILITLAALLCAFSYAQMPNGFSFQGYARNADGVPLKNLSELEVKFQLYTGSVLKFEELQTLTTNEFGTFQTVIGSINTSGFASLDFVSFDFLLKVLVKDGEGWNLVANKMLMAVPYAMAAKKADHATKAGIADTATNATYASLAKTATSATTADKVKDGSNGVPVGTIVPFAGKTNKVPSGWFLCDGSYKSKYTYSALYNIIGRNWGYSSSYGFRVPDLRGVFLRGVNHSASGDYSDPNSSSRTKKHSYGNTGNTVGSYQKHEIDSHYHTTYSAFYRTASQGASKDLFGYGAGGKEDFGNNKDTNSKGGDETRPVNAYVNYIIKY